MSHQIGSFSTDLLFCWHGPDNTIQNKVKKDSDFLFDVEQIWINLTESSMKDGNAEE